jgi:hypothetical protein
MLHRFVRIRSYRRFVFLLGVVIASIDGQTPSQPMVLLGSILNKTASAKYSGIHSALRLLLADLPQFSRTIVDTTLSADSFPNEASLMKARGLNTAYMLWGVVDSAESGLGISLKILDMKQGSVSHIRIMITQNENAHAIAEMVLSKLKLWLQRSTMVQLIVTTHPTAAGISLDGKHVGSTPFEGMVQPGTYHLKMTKKAQAPIQFPVSFISGNTYQYDFTMSSLERKTDHRPVLKWLAVSVACLGAGIVANIERDHAQARYREATPPADFDRLHNNTVAWEVGRDVLFAAAGAALCVMVIQVGFK